MYITHIPTEQETTSQHLGFDWLGICKKQNKTKKRGKRNQVQWSAVCQENLKSMKTLFYSIQNTAQINDLK